MFSLCALKVAADIRIVIVGLYSTHWQILVPPRSCFEVPLYPPPFLSIWGGGVTITITLETILLITSLEVTFSSSQPSQSI